VRTTTLATAGLLGLALLSPLTAANADGETCRGEAATIVGTPSNPALLGSDGVTGTEGRDVVVTNGAAKVSTLGGDDLICVTAGGSPSVKRVTIDAGAGDDVVDGTTAPDWSVQAELGEGADHFEGSDAGSSVHGAYSDAAPADTERDVIIGRDGSDGVHSGVVGHPNPDVIVLGAGDDSLIYGGVTASDGSIDGGTGVDQFFPSTLSTPGDTVIDNTAGRMLIAQQVVATWTGLETFWTGTIGGYAITFVGTAADETVYAKVSGRVHAAFGAGDDTFLADQAPRAGSVIDGGDGRDHVYVTSESGLLDLDLRRGKLVADAESPYTTPATSFEDASLFARRVVVGGTGSRNELRFSACDARLRGRGGADTIVRSYDSLFESVFCPRFPKAHLSGGSGKDDLEGTFGRDVLLGGRGRDELRGENGNDVLRGGGGSDRLLGGEGRDSLHGQAGRDRLSGGMSRDRADGGPGSKDQCRAERERRCER
jgi:Ca2+-binding RTX toxin-like protein